MNEEDYKFKKETGYFDEIKLSKKLKNLAIKKGFPLSDSKKLEYFLDGDMLTSTHLSLTYWLEYEHGVRLITPAFYEEKMHYGFIFHIKFEDQLDDTNLKEILTKDESVEFTGLTHEEVSTKGLEYLLNLIPSNQYINDKCIDC